MDTVFIEHLSVRGKHGIHEEERRTEQEFIIDISLETDLSKAGNSDTVADTVNYSDVRKIARETVEQNSFFLIEKLASVIVSRLLEDTRIASVSVTIRKPAVYTDSVPGITIRRTR